MADKQRRARAYFVALLVSVLVHLGLVLLVAFAWYRPYADPRSSAKNQPPVSQWTIVEVVPVPPPPSEPPPPRSPIRNVPAKRRAAKAPPTASPGTEPTVTEDALATDAPRAEAAEPSGPISLFPAPSLSPDGEVDVPRSQTLTPDDPSLQPEHLRREEERRVKHRVQGMVEEELAGARAQGGVPHPYFAGITDSVRAELGKRARETGVKATLGQFLNGAGHGYTDSLNKYGKSGDPNLGATGTPQRTPAPVGSKGDELQAALDHGAETQAALQRARPLVSLKLELRQFKDGRPLTAVVIQASGNAKFDALVLESWPKAMTDRGPPPDDAFRGPVLRSLWEIEGWLGLPKDLEKVTTYLPMPLGTDKLLGALTKEGYHYEFRTRLLRVY